MWQRIGDEHGDYYVGIGTLCAACKMEIYCLDYGLKENDDLPTEA